MINLLPHELKEDYRYARKNRRLVKWASAIVLAIFGMAAITMGGVIMMNNTSGEYRIKIAEAKADLASQNMAATQAQVGEISNNLKLMVAVLSKEILFSKLLARLAVITPPNTILTDLSISQTESAIDITAHTANYEAATQLQANLTDPNNKIFAKADLVSITCAATAGGTAAKSTSHPCTVIIRALFTDNNPFLFINANPKVGS
jgi:hypothetical protein